ncbi:flagellar export protein FliJ [Desertibacillus haloalkaliphilus]|uniref:flagellar export protein FliJ n=1 Tax=Desertibacillus haloalkaliphilus TaxID=1328930 RepID=UPI001C27C581|nr:flagellar export protein FliJ [Desertibacillus haloalkaliphilus]MBU8907011.1 flagellar export protein FliJ [Desertibacillus haloalkaliphilus]
MAFQFTLQKVLELKEKDKLTREQEYAQAMETFEESATQLYHLLKQKEDIEKSLQDRIIKGISIHELQRNEVTLMRLQTEISRQEQSTNYARDKMHSKQEALVNVSMEVKKYEKVKELKEEQYNDEMKRLESQFLDEISIQQFASR